MKHISKAEFSAMEFNIQKKRKKGERCEDIFTLDTECTSLFETPSGAVIAFDPTLPKQFWSKCTKIGICYIWMMSVKGQVFYSRYLEDLPDFMARIKEALHGARWVVYVHNLSYDFGVISGVLHVDKMFARKTHKPYRFELPEYNCEVRDSYILSMLSLENIAKDYKLAVEKMVGDLDYDKIRHPETPLTEKELGYCEHDCLVLNEYIKMKKEEYGSIYDIPMTQTGEVRRALKDNIIKHRGGDFRGFKSWQAFVATMHPDIDVWKMLLKAFAGGYTHANALHYGRYLKETVTSYDFTSDYPYVLMTCAFPMSTFEEVNTPLDSIDIKTYAYLIDIILIDVESIRYNTYISVSKCDSIHPGYIADNGRVSSAAYLRITITELDWDIIKRVYSFSGIEVISMRRAVKRFLPVELAEMVYIFYKNKSLYKGVKGKEAFYVKTKQMLNGIFGMCCTRTICDPIEYDDTETDWKETRHLTEEEVESELANQDGKELLPFQWGVWCTAYARHRLWEAILKWDEYVVYCDTDSIKLLPGFDPKWFEEQNKEIAKTIDEAAERYGLDASYLHPLGEWDGNDGAYGEFVTLGAKRYCYRLDKDFATKQAEKAYKKTGKEEDRIPDQQLHITVSGVSKQGAIALNDNIENFYDGFEFDVTKCGKKIVNYCVNQPSVTVTDYLGNVMTLQQKTGVCLQPTSYVMGVDDNYSDYCLGNNSRTVVMF